MHSCAMCVGKKTVSMVPQLQPTHQKGVNHSKKHHTHHNKKNVGGDLLSHTLPGAVPSALAGLASGFGKGPGVTPPQQPPTNTTGKHTPNHNSQCAVSSQTLHNRREYQPNDQNIHFRPHNCLLHRPISTSHLHTSQRFQIWPINPIISREPQKKPHLETGFPLRCFQRLSLPYVANQHCHRHDNWHTRGMSNPVLSY